MEILDYIFDLDGTLIDSVPGINLAVTQACRSVGLDKGLPCMRQYIGPPIRTMLARAMCTEDKVLLDSLEQAFRYYYDLYGWKESCPYPGVEKTLRTLHSRGGRLCLLTNKPRRPTILILELLGWHSFFDYIVTPDSPDFHFTHKEDAALSLSHRMGLCATKTLLVGDSADDFRAAQVAGFHFGAAAWGYGNAASLAPEYQLNAIKQILDYTVSKK